MESETQMSEEWNIKCSSLFQRFRSVTKKKIEKKRGGGELFSLTLTISHFTIFSERAQPSLRHFENKQKSI